MGASILPLVPTECPFKSDESILQRAYYAECGALGTGLCTSFPVFLLQPSSYAYLFAVSSLIFPRQDLMEPRLSSDSLFNGD